MPESPKVDLKQWLAPESWVSLSGAGPLAASITYALTVNLGAPSGWSMLAVCAVLAACVPFVHKNAGRVRKGALFAASVLVLFVQAAQFSTVLSHTSADLDEHVMHLGDVICGLVPNAGAQDADALPPLRWTVETLPEGYVLTPPATGSPIVLPFDAFDALMAHVAHRKAKEPDIKEPDIKEQSSPWSVKFTR